MSEIEILRQLISYLGGQVVDDCSLSDLQDIWRGLINQRASDDLSEGYLELEDQYLSQLERPLYRLADCQKTSLPQIITFTGDMTCLAVDILVNAANSDLLGCFIPNHTCLDNAIHTFSGARLRQECQALMTEQGHKEPVGQVKVTSAYHLPAKWIYHTVGPYIPQGKPVSALRKSMLKQCYLSCLKKAEQEKVASLAFPCISTGQFGFPKAEAAQIAIQTVRDFLSESQSEMAVVFCLYTPEDQAIYGELLGEDYIKEEEKT